VAPTIRMDGYGRPFGSPAQIGLRRKCLLPADGPYWLAYGKSGGGQRAADQREVIMAVATVTKLTASSPTSFEDAVREGVARANKTLRGITGLHVIDQKASVAGGKIAEYRVTMEITFILED
jgi:dodecin